MNIPHTALQPSCSPQTSLALLYRHFRWLAMRASRPITVAMLVLAFALVYAERVQASSESTSQALSKVTVFPPADAHSYRVQPGDALIRIAIRHGVSLAELAHLNRLSPNALVYVGQTLILPHDAARTEPDPSSDSPTELQVLPQTPPAAVVPFAYARVIQDDAPVYAQPSDIGLGLPPQRTLGVGYVWVSVHGKTTYEGQDFYQINRNEYVRADVLSFYSPSLFQGVALAVHPDRAFAWILASVQPARIPAGEVNAEAPAFVRYQLVQIFATEQLGEQVWYLVGPDQWINQVYVGKVTPALPPEGVGPNDKWIAVNLFEQTLAAYEGQKLVYATLVSTGLPGWDTPTGLYRVWLRVASGKMSGGYNRPDYYFLEDVPWTQYFNKDVALHTAYWHDRFGYRHSHGCVNLAPLDARWLFEWAPENVWVLVHAS